MAGKRVRVGGGCAVLFVLVLGGTIAEIDRHRSAPQPSPATADAFWCGYMSAELDLLAARDHRQRKPTPPGVCRQAEQAARHNGFSGDAARAMGDALP